VSAHGSTTPFVNLSLRRRPLRCEGPPAAFLPAASGPSTACGNLAVGAPARRWPRPGPVTRERGGANRSRWLRPGAAAVGWRIGREWFSQRQGSRHDLPGNGICALRGMPAGTNHVPRCPPAARSPTPPSLAPRRRTLLPPRPRRPAILPPGPFQAAASRTGRGSTLPVSPTTPGHHLPSPWFRWSLRTGQSGRVAGPTLGGADSSRQAAVEAGSLTGNQVQSSSGRRSRRPGTVCGEN